MRVLCAVLLSMLVGALAATQCNPSGSRQDCGYVGITQQQCEAKQCCWTPTNGLPWCYSANGPADTSSYQVVGESKRQNGITLNLKLSHGTAIHGADISQLVLDATFETRDRIRVRITDPQNKRYEIPQTLLPDPESEELKTLDVLNYEFSYTSNPFGFAVTRKSDSEVLFNTTTSKGFVFENQFLQISTALPENPNVYGFAERIDNLKLDLNKMYTMWSYDIPTPDHQNLYGVHPFYMEVRNGKAHSVFLKNSNAQEVYLESGMLTYFVTGGILDFYIMVGPSPDQATQQYHDVVGHPHMPPFWSLGWHQCRYGFKDLDEIKQVVKSYKDNNIPLDTIWADIDHMDAYKDFTWDPVNFPQSSVAEFVNTLHSENQKMVVIVDPGIHNVAGYAAYEDGLQKDLFIKRANGDVFIGKVWPGTTAFPDFTHPNTTDYWYGLIKEFLDKTPLDGLWIDMNEISNFCNGYCASEDLVNMIAISADGFDPNNPPYRINNANHQGPLNEKTLDMDCLHYNGELEYNLHTLFGHSEGIATKMALEKYYGKRSFILSRSTFAGSGKHVAHWLGDNHASFKSMQGSFPGALLFNILGIPLVGSDICGFMENANEELCNRWHSVGAFYPFARNHQALGTNFKYPYMWESVKEASIKSLNVRYSLLHYYYTLFYNAYVSGGTVMRPLFYEFPDESATMGIDQQFMIGPALLFSPCMVEGAVTVNAYFPKAKWYDYWTKKEVPTTYQGTSQTLSVPWSTIPIYYRGGYIVPSQTPALTSVETKANPFTFTVALDENNRAVGDLYVDDGEDLSVGAKSFKASLVAKNNAFSVEVLSNTYESVHELLVESVVVLGVSSAPSSVVVDGKTTAFKYDAESKVLSITGLNTSLDQFKSASWGGAEEIVIE